MSFPYAAALYTQRGVLIHGGKFVLGLGWTVTHRGTYSWREVCVRFRMDLHTQGHLFMEGSLC